MEIFIVLKLYKKKDLDFAILHMYAKRKGVVETVQGRGPKSMIILRKYFMGRSSFLIFIYYQ